MSKEEILKILEDAKDKNSDVPMRLVRQAFEKLREPCEDTISRQALCEYALNQKDKSVTPNDIMRFPSAQPERKTGKWTKENACEFCGFQPWFERDIHTLSFCPNCGADMRRAKHERLD